MLARGASVRRPAVGAGLHRGRGWLAVGRRGPHALAAFAERRQASTAAASSSLLADCPFSILKIEPTEDIREIKRAYFEAASRCHPDVMPASVLSMADPKASAQEFLLVTAAYQALQDPWTRASLTQKTGRAETARARPTAGRNTTDRQDRTWRREQQEMDWCELADAIIHPSGSVLPLYTL